MGAGPARFSSHYLFFKGRGGGASSREPRVEFGQLY